MANQTDDQKAKADADAKAQADADAKALEAKAQAEADAEAAAQPLDQTDPGGRYVVNGVTVDANGKPLKGEA